MPISGKEMLRRYLEKGWSVVRQRGSHVTIGKGTAREVIPIHGNQDLSKGLESRLLKRLREE
jgi:predicted RNA binding protein YcfA (HicA-like mRNA interferase family)